MAFDKYITELDALTSLTDDDLLVVVDDPSSAPETKKITWSNFKGSISAFDISSGGWVSISDSWSYASASTITVPSGAASIYKKGMGLRLKQGGSYKYYYIITVADTLLTVTGGSDYTVANSAITDIGITLSPSTAVGFPSYFNTASISFDTARIDNGSGVAVTSTSSYFVINGAVCKHFVARSGNSYKVGTDQFLARFPRPSTMPTPTAHGSGTGAFGLANVLCIVTDYGATNTDLYCSATANMTDNTQSNGFSFSYDYVY